MDELKTRPYQQVILDKINAGEKLRLNTYPTRSPKYTREREIFIIELLNNIKNSIRRK